MKNTFSLLFLLSGFFVQAQSLKDALFSGKLKNQPGTVIRKGDDLASKMDTAYKVPAADTAKAGATASVTESATKTQASQADISAPTATTANKDVANAQPDSAAATTTETTGTPKETVAKPKDNNAIWKEYINNLTANLKTEVLSSKKVKKGDYYVLVSYAIETDGKVTVTDVFVDPENSFLQQQIKDKISLEAPQLNPVLNSAGAPRKVNKKANFTLTKE